MVFGRARERARGEPGESEREQGGRRGVVQGHRGEEGRAGRQGERWRGAVAVRARRPHSPPSVGTKTTEEGGGLGRLLAGPASWLG